jgi:hypothetical protein
MKRTQLYLDEELWSALHAQARRGKTTISDLVRQAARERYLGGIAERSQAMHDFVGIRKGPAETVDAVELVRNLRRGDRLKRLQK